MRTGFWWSRFRALAPVVRKLISANPRLNRPNPRNKFVLRLNSVSRSSISTIQGLNWGLNLTHLARWINSLIGWKSSRTNQNGGLTLCWVCFNPEPSEERKAIQAIWRFFRIWFILSRTSHSAFGFPALFRVFTSRTETAVQRSVKCFTRRGRGRSRQDISTTGRNCRLLAAVM